MLHRGTRRPASRVAPDRGGTVLLPAPLVERREQDLDEGLARLRGAPEELGHLPLDELCDALLGRLLPCTREDDVAMLAVRMHRQDRPRPAQAGPRSVPPTCLPSADPRGSRGALATCASGARRLCDLRAVRDARGHRAHQRRPDPSLRC